MTVEGSRLYKQVDNVFFSKTKIRLHVPAEEGSRLKKLTFFDMSAKASSPPPYALTDI